MFSPAPKPRYKRKKPTRKKRGEFSKETRERLLEDCGGMCRLCGKECTEIHHVKFKSQGGRGVYTNGLPVCQPCHVNIHQDFDLATSLREKFIRMHGKDYYKDDWD